LRVSASLRLRRQPLGGKAGAAAEGVEAGVHVFEGKEGAAVLWLIHRFGEARKRCAHRSRFARARRRGLGRRRGTVRTLRLRERPHPPGVDRLAVGADGQRRQIDDRHQQLLDVQLGIDVALGRTPERAQCVDTGRHGRRSRRLSTGLPLERCENVVVPHTQHVAVSDPVAGGAAFAERLHVVVDVHAVGAHVLEIEMTIAELHARVMRRYVALRVGQHPVVVSRAADGAALYREDRAAALTQRTTLFADDPQPEHGSPTQMSDPLCDNPVPAFP